MNTVIVGRHQLDEVNMPGIALRNHESEYERTGERKPPRAETSHWLKDLGDTNIPSQAEVPGTGKSVQNPVAFPTFFPTQERLLNAREVAARLGVSERWVRDHTTRRSPKIRAVKLGSLIRYRRADVEIFMENLDTARPSRQPRFGV